MLAEWSRGVQPSGLVCFGCAVAVSRIEFLVSEHRAYTQIWNLNGEDDDYPLDLGYIFGRVVKNPYFFGSQSQYRAA